MGSFSFFQFLPCFFLLLSSCSAQQLSSSQAQTLFRIKRALEYPQVLNGWNRYTSFCYLPSSANLSISCFNGSITAVTIVGNRPNSPDAPRNQLSGNFSIDSLLTTLSRLPTITNISLVSLGIWGELPATVGRFGSLENLNLSSNFLYGKIPNEISELKNMKSLDLGWNSLKGSVPDLAGLDVLEHLDLGMNNLGPEFPTLGKNLVVLQLRNNSFMANLPSWLKNMTNLQVFDASDNRLFGTIPSFLFSLPSIRHLELSGNSLSGTLPKNLHCGRTLHFVDISNNKLVGRPPECLVSNSSTIDITYSWNCFTSVTSSLQHPNSFCNQMPLAVIPPLAEKKGKGSKNVLGLVLGIVGGGVLLVVVLILLLMNKARARDGTPIGLKIRQGVEKNQIQVSPAFTISAGHMSPEVRFCMLGHTPYHVFEMEELEEATDDFDRSNLLQETSLVQLYKGRIQDGSSVTIRCLKLKQKHSPQILLQYMDAFSKLQHRHIVSILGHCIAESKDESGTTTVYLVFEHISNGTLRSHLTEWRKRELLKWPQRVNAVIGVARGIQFLHTVTVPGIYGNDLKMENILMDQTLTAKIQNYNLPTTLRNKNKADSDFPFSALEEKGIDSMKHGDVEDVYQLGLILLEVITGKSAASEGELEVLKVQMKKILTDGEINLNELTDSAIHGTFAYDSLKTVVEVTLNCLSKDPTKRPSVDDVLWNLQYSVQVQDGCGSSEALSFRY